MASMTNGGGAVVGRVNVRLHYCLFVVAALLMLVVASLRFAPPAMAAAAAAAAAVRAASVSSGGDGGVGPDPGRPVIFNFGDSNSDTGGAGAANGFPLSRPEGRAFFPYPTGRFSDGRLVIDFLCESLKIKHLSPYLKALGADFTNGVNFAVGGSTTLPRDAYFVLRMQVRQFLYFKARSLEFIKQGLRAPMDESGFQNALYMIDIGQNDVSYLLAALPYHQVLAGLPPILAEIKDAIQTLYVNGARNFWIHGTGALGCLPQKLAAPRKDDSDLDENGCLRSINNVAKSFNSRLSSLCDEMRSKLKDATVVYTDMFAIKYDLVANHTNYGIDRPLMTCCGYGGPPYNYDPQRSCMGPAARPCEDGSKFISWDGVHFTQAANAAIAAKIQGGEYSKPRLKFHHFFNVR